VDPIYAVLLVLQQAGSVTAGPDPLAPSAPTAVPEEQTEKDQPIVVEAKKPKQVCEFQSSTGSLFTRRVCRSEAQVAADAEVARQSLDMINRDRQARQQIQEALQNR
jgi:hypothetical protein